MRLGDNPTVRLDLDNEPQPDAVLLIDSSAGGQSSLGEDGYIPHSAPPNWLMLNDRDSWVFLLTIVSDDSL